MNRSLEPTLTGLIPTLTGPIPPELIDYATSLLALSRQRVGALKPEEESARAYLCAHIACERLRLPLDLPPVQPRPPLPKRQYNLLHTQFSNALPPAGSGSPTKKAPPPPPPRPAPRHAAAAAARTRGAQPPPKQIASPDDPVSALIVRICTHKLLSQPQKQAPLTTATTSTPTPTTTPVPAETIIRHMLACAAAIRLPPPSPSNPADTRRAMATLAAVYILTEAKLSEKVVTPEVYTRERALLCAVLADLGEAGVGVGGGSTSTTNKPPTRKEPPPGCGGGGGGVKVTHHTDIDAALNKLIADPPAVAWLANVPRWAPGADAGPAVVAQTADEATAFEKWVDPDLQEPTRGGGGGSGGARRAGGGGGGAGGGNADFSAGAAIGRMVQERVEYLSERKRRGYVEWKRDVLRRVAGIEGGAGVGKGKGEGTGKGVIAVK